MEGDNIMKEFGLPWIAHLLLIIFLDPIWAGIVRISRKHYVSGIVWIVTGGLFGIGWIIDIVTMAMHKDITFWA